MGIVPYLAMTAAEFRAAPSLPEKCAWMACHFSPYSTGLSNLPEVLPENSLLILNDRTPIHAHDPDIILSALKSTVDRLHCSALLLDFQRENIPETDALVKTLLGGLPCPVAVSEGYAKHGGIVFLPPLPPDVPLAEHLAPWKNRSIWLEAALDSETLLLTESGTRMLSEAASAAHLPQHADSVLHCHYQIIERETGIEFHLFRTAQDLLALLDEAQALGVQAAVGLYQELGDIPDFCKTRTVAKTALDFSRAVHEQNQEGY